MENSLSFPHYHTYFTLQQGKLNEFTTLKAKAYYYLTRKELDKKEYYAIVYGIIDTVGKIDSPIGRNRHNNLMMVTKTGANALTHYKPIKYYDNKTLLNVEIKTGRTHQIRVHMSSIKHPLVGDKMYGTLDDASRVMLHCQHIGFVHPILGYWVDFYAELPNDMKKIMGE